MTTAPSLTAELISVRDVFTSSTSSYAVPDYQRNYAWTTEQIEQLLDDVISAQGADASGNGSDPGDGRSDYFLGNLVTTRLKGTAAGSEVEWEVVDGQQRLTTLFIILNVLGWHPAASSSLAQRLTYRARRRASTSLQHITTVAGPYRAPAVTVEHDSAILGGWRVVSEYLERKASDPGDRSALTEFLLDRVKLIRAELPAGTDLNRYFEVMNTRGQQLSPVDIVKAKLMRPLESDSERKAFDEIWTACSEMDTYVQMSLTRDKTNQRTAVFGETWEWVGPDLDFEGICEILAPGVSTTDSSRAPESIDAEHSVTLLEATRKYAGVSEVKQGPDIGSQRFRSTIRFPAFLLHALRTFPDFSADDFPDAATLDDKRLIESFAECFSSIPEADLHDVVTRFAMHLLRTRNVFDAFIVKRMYTSGHADDGEWSLRRLSKSRSEKDSATYLVTFGPSSQAGEGTDAGTREVLLLQSMLRVTYTSVSTMHWITDVLKQADNNTRPTRDDLASALQDTARRAVKEAYFDRTERPTGFAIERIVFTYLDYLLLDEDSLGEEYRRNFTFVFRSSIEHFHPRHRDQEQDAPTVSKTNQDLLGNLALITVAANSRYNNSSPGTKAQEFPEVPRQSTKLKIMTDSTNKAAGLWDDRSVVGHHKFVEDLLKQDCSAAPQALT